MPTHTPGDQSPGSRKPTSKEITPELVQKISERVFAMLLSELKIEKERSRPCDQRQGYFEGRRYGR